MIFGFSRTGDPYSVGEDFPVDGPESPTAVLSDRLERVRRGVGGLTMMGTSKEAGMCFGVAQ